MSTPTPHKIEWPTSETTAGVEHPRQLRAAVWTAPADAASTAHPAIAAFRLAPSPRPAPAGPTTIARPATALRSPVLEAGSAC